MNNGKFNEKGISSELKRSAKGAGVDAAKMKAAAESGNLEEYLGKNLAPDMQQKLKNVLSDQKTLQKLLSGKEAQELLKKFGKE